MALTNSNMVPVTANLVAGQRLVRVKGSKIWFPVGLGGNVGQIVTYVENSPISPDTNETDKWVISADSIKANYSEPYKAFQDKSTDLFNGFWVSNSITGTLTWRNKNEKVLVQAYQVQTCRENVGTTAWVLEGSNDGSDWKTIDTRAGVPISLAYPIVYNCHSNLTSYYYHRLRAITSTTNTVFNMIKTYSLNANGTDATPDDMLLGKKAFTVDGLKIGTIPTIEIINDGVNITVQKGYNPEEQTFEIGINTSDATATADDILLNKTAYINGEKITGSIAESIISQEKNVITVTKGYLESDTNITIGNIYEGTTIIPSVNKQTIPANTYIEQEIEISGDENLNSGNIKAGVSIFGVEGSLTETGVDTSDASAVSSDIILDKTAYVNGLKVVGTYTPKKEIRKALLIFGN